jgi:hypothetical protein
MSLPQETPFESIEDAHQFIKLLEQTISETKADIEADLGRESISPVPRRLQALQLTLYTLKKLDFHLRKSGRVLNDLRTLRRLLFEERKVTRASSSHEAATHSAAPVLETVSRVSRKARAVGRGADD